MSDHPNDNDPFKAFESDRTVIKPSAGRAGARPAAGVQSPGPAAMLPEPQPLPDMPGAAGFNPLLQAAAPLLAAAPRIRMMSANPRPAALRAALIDGVQRFEAKAAAAGMPQKDIVAGRYVLCTFLDESASSTPWGGSGVWGSQSLLVHFHNETFGGEKVFQVLAKLVQDVPGNRNLLELIYAALALGFEGRYRVLDNGRAQLEDGRARLADMLRKASPTVDKTLSPRWEGLHAPARRLRDGIPVWVVGCGAALALMLVFVGLRFGLADAAGPTYAALAAIDVPKPPAAPPPQPAEKPRLAGLLAPDIQAGLLEVRDYSDRSVIVIRGDGFFEPGSSDVADRVKPLLGRIAAALKPLPGPVLVTGHTDNQPIRSLRFPSNWHLSTERADAVKALLGATLDANRLKAEGRADAEPVDDNATPAGRARNRRVEVTLAATPNS